MDARPGRPPVWGHMRRTIIGRPAEMELQAQRRARALEALLFDLGDQTGTLDQTLAERRVGSWTFGPWLLLIAHLILSATMLMEGRTHLEPSAVGRVCIPILIAMLLDASAGMVMLYWRRLQIAPHRISLFMCLYVAASGGLWTLGSGSAGALLGEGEHRVA